MQAEDVEKNQKECNGIEPDPAPSFSPSLPPSLPPSLASSLLMAQRLSAGGSISWRECVPVLAGITRLNLVRSTCYG